MLREVMQMPRFRFVKKFDVKAPDSFILRSNAMEWLEHRLCVLEEVHNEFLKCPPDDEDQRKHLSNKYNNNFCLLEHAVRFMCEVDLMSYRTGKEYADKMYKFVIDDLEICEKKRRKEE